MSRINILRRCITILCFILSVTQNQARAQASDEKIKQLIDSLSWNSITMDEEFLNPVLTHLDKTEKALLKVGKVATLQLIQSLSDRSKTVIAHIILSQLWEPKNAQNHLNTQYIYKDCNKSIGWHQIYNGLVWEWNQKIGSTIEQKEIEKIKNYWTLKLIEKKPMIRFTNSKIMAELYKQDNILYPCNKVYSNSSASVKYNDIFSLLKQKANNPRFQALWTKFGNDSTMSMFDDSFYINYGAEGLSFRFGSDSTLTSIFVELPYKGELPYKLKLTDLKATVNKKMGKPSESRKWSDNISNTYKKEHLFLDFDKKSKIIKFGISAD